MCIKQFQVTRTLSRFVLDVAKGHHREEIFETELDMETYFSVPLRNQTGESIFNI